MKCLLKVLLAVTCLALVACGGGGGGGTGSTPVTPVTPASPDKATSATVAYNIINNGSSNITGMQFVTYLPSGVSVGVDPGTNTIAATNIVAGSALSGLQIQTSGTFDTSLHKVSIVITATDKQSLQTGFKSGEIVKLTCSISPGSNVIAHDFQTTHTGKPIDELAAYSYNQSTKAADDITSTLIPSLTATLQ